MKVVCQDCGKEFFVPLKVLSMLSESFKRNPQLKFICIPCGKEVEKRYTG